MVKKDITKKDMPDLLAKYRVIVSGNIVVEADRQAVLEALSAVFKSSPSTMEALLQGKPVALKKAYDQAHATSICEKIRQAGAQCHIEEIPESKSDRVIDSAISPPDDSRLDDSYERSDTGAVVGDHSREDESAPDPESAHHPDSDTRRDVLFNLMLMYVGTKLDFYRQQFLKFGNPWQPKFRISWNWPAFFFFFFWALYRKMWLYAAVYFAGGFVLTMYSTAGIFSLIWLFFWPLVANFLYFKRATAAAKAAIANFPDNPTVNSLAQNTYLNKGGVSKLAVGLSICVVLFGSYIAGDYLSNQFMQEYDPGAQIRGDGSPIEGNIEPSSARTHLILNYLGTFLKFLLVTGESGENRHTIEGFVAKLIEDGVTDDWGQDIGITQTFEGYELRSAGADLQMNTADDVIQPVTDGWIKR